MNYVKLFDLKGKNSDLFLRLNHKKKKINRLNINKNIKTHIYNFKNKVFFNKKYWLFLSILTFVLKVNIILGVICFALGGLLLLIHVNKNINYYYNVFISYISKKKEDQQLYQLIIKAESINDHLNFLVIYHFYNTIVKLTILAFFLYMGLFHLKVDIGLLWFIFFSLIMFLEHYYAIINIILKSYFLFLKKYYFILSSLTFKVYIINLIFFYKLGKFSNRNGILIKYNFLLTMILDLFIFTIGNSIIYLFCTYYIIKWSFYFIYAFYISSVLLLFYKNILSAYYSKLSDVAGDIIGKIYLKKEDDDETNPLKIADNIGDLTGDHFGSINSKRILMRFICFGLFFCSVFFRGLNWIIFILYVLSLMSNLIFFYKLSKKKKIFFFIVFIIFHLIGNSLQLCISDLFVIIQNKFSNIFNNCKINNFLLNKKINKQTKNDFSIANFLHSNFFEQLHINKDSSNFYNYNQFSYFSNRNFKYDYGIRKFILFISLKFLEYTFYKFNVNVVQQIILKFIYAANLIIKFYCSIFSFYFSIFSYFIDMSSYDLFSKATCFLQIIKKVPRFSLECLNQLFMIDIKNNKNKFLLTNIFIYDNDKNWKKHSFNVWFRNWKNKTSVHYNSLSYIFYTTLNFRKYIFNKKNYLANYSQLANLWIFFVLLNKYLIYLDTCLLYVFIYFVILLTIFFYDKNLFLKHNYNNNQNKKKYYLYNV